MLPMPHGRDEGRLSGDMSVEIRRHGRKAARGLHESQKICEQEADGFLPDC
jgi:hypothetical protein